MNISNIEHFIIIGIFSLMWLFRCRFWTFFICAMICIELDQAISYAHPWYVWFVQLDTILDLISGAAGMVSAWWLFRTITAWEINDDY